MSQGPQGSQGFQGRQGPQPVNTGLAHYVEMAHTENTGVNGGDAVLNAWTDLPITDLLSDVDNVCSLGANQFTLDSGRWDIRAVQAATTYLWLRLYDYTHATVLLYAPAIRSTGVPTITAVLSGQFTLDSLATLAIQYYCPDSQGDIDLGQAWSVGTLRERYLTVDIMSAANVGPQGSQGSGGSGGVQGAQGPRGYLGSRGFQGFQGLRGFQGLQGIQGLQGARGFQGLQGAQGLQGLQGNQGLQGPQGFQGFQGFQGRQGANPTYTDSITLVGDKGLAATNSYLLSPDGVPLNVTPYVLPFGCQLEAMSLTTDGSFTWTAEIHVNGTLKTDAVLTAVTQDNVWYSDYSTVGNFSEGDKVSLYVNGSLIASPLVTAIFKRIS